MLASPVYYWPALSTTGQHFLLLASSSKLILAVLLALLVWRTHPPDRPKSFVKNDNIIFGASINDTGSQKTAPLPLKNCLHAFRKSSKLFVVVCSRHAKNPPDIIIINPLEKKRKTKNVTKINHCFPFFKFFFYGAILLDIQIGVWAPPESNRSYSASCIKRIYHCILDIYKGWQNYVFSFHSINS